MNRVEKSLAGGISITALMTISSVVLFGLGDACEIPVLSNVLFGFGVVFALTLLPGAPLGILSLNMHSTGFALLALIGNAIFYSYLASRIFATAAKNTIGEGRNGSD